MINTKSPKSLRLEFQKFAEDQMTLMLSIKQISDPNLKELWYNYLIDQSKRVLEELQGS